MDNMRERLIVRIMVFMMGLFTAAYIYAADETVTMKVGETKTLYLPSSVISKAPRAASWISTRPNEIQVMSYTTYSVTIKAAKSVPATTTCLVNCRYYYIVYRGTFIEEISQKNIL